MNIGVSVSKFWTVAEIWCIDESHSRTRVGDLHLYRCLGNILRNNINQKVINLKRMMQ